MRTLSPVALLSLLGALTFGAGCGGNATTSASLPQSDVGAQSTARSAPVGAPFVLHFPAAAFAPRPLAKPGDVTPDVNSKKSTEPIDASGGSLTVPAFAKFTGSIGYTPNNAPNGTTITLISSVKDLAHVPNPPKGTAIFYIQATLSSSQPEIAFQTGNASGTLASPGLIKKKTYTVYAYALGQLVGTAPAGHPKDGKLTFASPVDGQTIPTGITVTVQLAQN